MPTSDNKNGDAVVSSAHRKERRKVAATPRPPEQGPAVRHLVGKCQRCYFWETETFLNVPRLGKGLCRRRSPQLIVVNSNQTQAVWPVTACDEWCGEFKEA